MISRSELNNNTLDVENDFAILPDLELRKILLIAQIIAQSTALQLIEWRVEKFLSESEDMTRFLKHTGFVRRGRRNLLQFIGESLSTRHKIVRQMAMLKRPDVTWESDELYELYDQMVKIDVFDIEPRISNVDKMLEVSSEVTDLLLEVNHTRRSEIMEIIVIVLITIEVVKAFFE
ncbi:MAG: RMD1 family protein [bacterium]|nr:RMD1 family protein [bacterium]